MSSGSTLAIALFILAVGTVGPVYLLAKRVGLIVPLAFIAAYVLAIGTITHYDVFVLGWIDVSWRQIPAKYWLELSWPVATVLYAPSAILALLACWFSRPSTRSGATALLGLYLFLILVLTEFPMRVPSAAAFWLLLVLPSAIFFAIAFAKRVTQGQRWRTK